MTGCVPPDFRVFVFQFQLGKSKSPLMIMAAFLIAQALRIEASLWATHILSSSEKEETYNVQSVVSYKMYH